MSNFINLKDCAELLLKWDNILILSHKAPDGDTLGSAYGLMAILSLMGKKARVECSDIIPEKYSYFTDVLPQDLFEPKYIIAVDIADEKLFGEKTEKYLGKISMAIDHHISHKPFAEYIYLNAKSASNTENIYDIAKELKAEITPHIADCLYTGMTTDTGCFKYSNTTPSTYRAAADLIELGASYAEINKIMFDTKSKQRLELEKIVLENMEFYFDNRVAFVAVTDKMFKSSGASTEDFEGISAMTRQIEGVEAGIVLREKDNGFKVSMRTNSYLDASKICGTMGGGGHKRAAGAFLELDLENAKSIVIDKIKQELESL